MKRLSLLMAVCHLACGMLLATDSQPAARAADKKFDWWQTAAPAAHPRAASKKASAPARAAETTPPRDSFERLAIEPLRWPRAESAPRDSRWVIEIPR